MSHQVVEGENSTSPPDSIASYLELKWLLLVTLVVRGGLLAWGFESLEADPDAYRSIAENLARHGVFGSVIGADGDVVPTAFRPPLYPLLLAAVAWNGQLHSGTIAGLHLALALLSVALLWRLGQWWQPESARCAGSGDPRTTAWSGDPRTTAGSADPRTTAGRLGQWWQPGSAASIACLLFIGDPILLNQSTLVMTETLAVLMAIATLLAWTWFSRHPTVGRAMAAGGVLGLACLCRPTFLAWAVLCVLAVVLRARGGAELSAAARGGSEESTTDSRRPLLARRIVWAFACLVGVVFILAPWTIRNQIVMGKPIFTTTHGGYTLLLANNPWFYQHLREAGIRKVWDAKQLQRHLPPLPEMDADRQAYEMARDTIRRQPGMFAYSILVRIERFWSPLPHRLDDGSATRRFGRYLVAVWYLLLYGFALGGCRAVRLSAPPWVWGMLLCVALTITHAVYWSDMRMRGPLAPVLVLLAGTQLGRLLDMRRK